MSPASYRAAPPRVGAPTLRQRARAPANRRVAVSRPSPCGRGGDGPCRPTGSATASGVVRHPAAAQRWPGRSPPAGPPGPRRRPRSRRPCSASSASAIASWASCERVRERRRVWSPAGSRRPAAARRRRLRVRRRRRVAALLGEQRVQRLLEGVLEGDLVAEGHQHLAQQRERRRRRRPARRPARRRAGRRRPGSVSRLPYSHRRCRRLQEVELLGDRRRRTRSCSAPGRAGDRQCCAAAAAPGSCRSPAPGSALTAMNAARFCASPVGTNVDVSENVGCVLAGHLQRQVVRRLRPSPARRRRVVRDLPEVLAAVERLRVGRRGSARAASRCTLNRSSG